MNQHEPIYWAPEKKLGGGWVCFKSSPAAPPAPDYQGAATATATGNKENLQFQTNSNRYNQYTPYGNETWTAGNPDTGQGWSSTINLDPTAKRTLDTQMNLSNQMGDLTSKSMGAVDAQGPMDLSSVQKIADQSYADQTARLDPQWQTNTNAQENKLVNQGLRPGMEGYDTAMRDFNNSKNDAYTQARQAANATMPQTYQLAQSTYDQPLNRANALRTGAQVQNPQFAATPGAGYTPGADMTGAANGQNQYNMGLYNSQVGGNNSAMGGMMQAGGAIGSAAMTAGMFSDRRLKSNIKRIGTHPRGFGVYEYDIFNRREIGVMAQEVEKILPEAVLQHPSGYLMVNYAAL